MYDPYILEQALLTCIAQDPSTPNKHPSSSTTIPSHTPFSDAANHIGPSLRSLNVRNHMEHRMFIDKGVLDKTEMADFPYKSPTPNGPQVASLNRKRGGSCG